MAASTFSTSASQPYSGSGVCLRVIDGSSRSSETLSIEFANHRPKQYKQGEIGVRSNGSKSSYGNPIEPNENFCLDIGLDWDY